MLVALKSRRAFLGAMLGATAAAGAPARAGARRAPRQEAVTGMKGKSYDVAVIGAGCFGAWSAWHLREAGRSVLLLDPYGAGHSRSSSGGESRVIRMGYGPDELYTRFSMRSLEQWKALFERVGEPSLFQPTGVLWMALEGDARAEATLATLGRVGVRHERLSNADLRGRYPQIATHPKGWAVLEPASGALLARRAVQAVVREAVSRGVDFALASALPPQGEGRLAELRTAGGDVVRAGAFVFACGPWLPKVTPRALEGRIFPTRQEVFYFGVPAGDPRFAPPAMPTWIDFGQEFYGLPDLESRGFKVAADQHGRPIDPDSEDRVVSAEGLQKARAFLKERFPALAAAPLVEARVCQYENTSSGDFVIDRHPGFDNVWVAGGGSGHGFKHGPAVGEYVAARLAGKGPVEARFSLATKEKAQKRAVF
jgi:monomeric sarcosine oxidase